MREVEQKITDCLATLEGLVTLLDAAAVYPSTDPVAYQRMFGGFQLLATQAEHQLQEIEFAEVFKEAPAPEATGTSAAHYKKVQHETTTKTPVPAIAEKYPEVVQLLKKGLPVKDISEKTKISISQIYKIKSEVM